MDILLVLVLIALVSIDYWVCQAAKTLRLAAEHLRVLRRAYEEQTNRVS